MTYRTRITFATATFALLVGCNETPAPPAASTPASGEAAQPASLAVGSASARPNRDSDRERARRERAARGKGGPAVLIQKALRELELDEQQKKTLQDTLSQEKKGDEERVARQELNEALAAGARAGALDDELVNGKVLALETAMKTKSTQTATTLNTLHQTLTPEQRKAFVASLEAGGTPMWSDDDAGSDRGRSRRLQSARGGSRIELARVMRGLNLSEEQRKKMKEAMTDDEEAPPKDREARLIEIKKSHQALKEAFASDTFDAVALTADPASAARRTAGIHREVKAIRTLLTILDAEQREKLAKTLTSPSGRPGRQRLGGRDGTDDPRRSVRRNRPAIDAP